MKQKLLKAIEAWDRDNLSFTCVLLPDFIGYDNTDEYVRLFGSDVRNAHGAWVHTGLEVRTGGQLSTEDLAAIKAWRLTALCFLLAMHEAGDF